MACNCATQEQLNELYRKYGQKVEPGAKETWNFRVKKFFTNILLYTVMCFIAPMLFCYVIGKGLFSKEKKISLRKFFHLKKDEEISGMMDSQFVSNIQ